MDEQKSILFKWACDPTEWDPDGNLIEFSSYSDSKIKPKNVDKEIEIFEKNDIKLQLKIFYIKERIFNLRFKTGLYQAIIFERKEGKNHTLTNSCRISLLEEMLEEHDLKNCHLAIRRLEKDFRKHQKKLKELKAIEDTIIKERQKDSIQKILDGEKVTNYPLECENLKKLHSLKSSVSESDIDQLNTKLGEIYATFIIDQMNSRRRNYQNNNQGNGL